MKEEMRMECEGSDQEKEDRGDALGPRELSRMNLYLD